MIKKGFLTFSLVLFLMLLNSNLSNGCTNFLITRGASVDGSTMISYTADSHTLYGELYFWPSAKHQPGAMRDIYEWDTGKFLGKIEQPPFTYSVIGNMNEYQLTIGETTFGGREELATQDGAIMDYGSLIYVALQRAKTAREAIEVMTSLVEKYGYASSGESFSIADPNEVWIMEMIGKGKGEKGAVWVALRIPDGFISGHANQARITTFTFEDPKNCLYSKDVVSFAREKGWFKGKNADFSFSDVYAPVDFSGARFCDARVWSGFNRVTKTMNAYVDYAKGVVKHGGENNFPVNRMPLWVKPDKLLSQKDVMELMRDHYQGTPLDMTQDIGAGPYQLPYRWRGLTWKVDSATYCNERAISTQQTGFSFVSQCRNWLPNPIGGILWFGVDDSYSTCYVPVYCGSTEIPECFAVGNGDMLNYSPTSAFWVFNTVSNLAYLRYSDMIKDIRTVQHELEGKYISYVPLIDKAAAELYKTSPDNARKFITEFSVNESNNMTRRWEKLGQYLLVKYLDGNVKKEENGKFKQNEYGQPAGPAFPGYPEWWYRMIANSTGEKLKVPTVGSH